MYSLLVFLCASMAFQVTIAAVKPRDLIDEAQKQLQTLQSLVQGNILAAHDELDNLDTDFNTYTTNVMSVGALAIQEQHDSIIAEIDTLKELANGAGKDVTTCTDTTEELLNRLPAEATVAMMNCGNDLRSESAGLLKNSQYIIDININKIFSLQNDLKRCGNSVTCVEPIVTEIELDMVRLPANIKAEVNAVESQLSIVKLSVDQCSDVEVTTYVGESNAVFTDITTCINRILDRP